MARIKTKRGAFFSTDALIAIIIIFLVILIVYPLAKKQSIESDINQDIISTLSTLKIGEIDNLYVKSLINQGIITDLNKTVMEQIGEFYVTNLTLAENITTDILKNLDTRENIGIWFENTLIASKNKTPIESAKQIDASRQIISGIQEGENIKGYSARAFLKNSLQNKYFYFGGYIGDGNITTSIEYNGEIKSANIEIAINKEFEIYINGIYSGNYSASPNEFTPIIHTIPIENMHSGDNSIGLRGDNIYIAGGFIKISYESQGKYFQSEEKNIPGVDGLINIYDGITIPENLEDLEIVLHMDSNLTVFAILGNTTIFQDKTNGEETITLNNQLLSSLLNYNELEEKTTPLRIGLENISYVLNYTKDVDLSSVTDISGSMEDSCGGNPKFFCCLFSGNFCSSENTCNYCGGNWESKLTSAKGANNLLIDSVLNFSNNRVGLVGYQTTALNSDYHPLSKNTGSLKSIVSGWDAGGSTCICCGINKARWGFINDSTPEKLKAMVVMSDGIANVECPEQNTGNAKQDAIQAACEAYQENNITVHAVGFGSLTDESTLQAIATCGSGEYYFSDVDDIAELYQQIAGDIIEGAYIEQTLETSGNISSKLYSDSHIRYGYNQTESPFGLTITTEKIFDDEYSGQFSIANDSTVLEATAISYSGPRWTKEVKLNSQSIYNIDQYGTNYTRLGDPYSIKIPTSLIGENNIVEISTGNSPQNSTAGSASNKIIYSVLKNVSAFSPISANANGCIWNIQFEDGSNITSIVPTEYPGSIECYYQEKRLQYDINDAIQSAVFNLLEKLDLNSNEKVDVEFTSQDLQIDFSEVTGIPYPWSTEMQVRKWI